MTTAHNREDGGRLVREAWVEWAKTQPNPKPSWLVSWDDLSETDREADRCIWDEIATPYIFHVLTLKRHIDRLTIHNESLQERVNHYEENKK